MLYVYDMSSGPIAKRAPAEATAQPQQATMQQAVVPRLLTVAEAQWQQQQTQSRMPPVLP